MPHETGCHLKLNSLSNELVSSHRSPRSCIHLRTSPELLPLTTTYLYFPRPLFASEYDLKRYVLNNMKCEGTEIFVMNLRNPNKNLDVCELEATANDIILNAECLKQLEISFSPGSFETSLKSFAKYLYLQHPAGLTLTINQVTTELKNPYD